MTEAPQSGLWPRITRFVKRLYHKWFSRSRYYPEGIWDEFEKQPQPKRHWWRWW